MVRMLAGKRFSGGDLEGVRFLKPMREFFEFLGMFLVSDSLPFLRWLDWGGYEKVMKKTAKELDHILGRWLEEHKRRRLGEFKVDDDQQDFMDVMLSMLDGASAEDLRSHDTDTIIKSTCLALLAGGTETTIVTLTWALSLLLNNRHVLQKTQDELDHYVGRERRIEESDVKNLSYIQAIIKETLRLYPALPLLAPHESMEDCTVGGYHVPAGTRLVVNNWKIQRDPRSWSDPLEFRPERFLTSQKEVDVGGQHFEFIPFGSGRRVCPGIALTFQLMEFALAHLLHAFQLETPSEEPVDMSESFGLTNLKLTPLNVLFSPRLPTDLYDWNE